MLQSMYFEKGTFSYKAKARVRRAAREAARDTRKATSKHTKAKGG